MTQRNDRPDLDPVETASPAIVTLDTQWLYQNTSTGLPSQNPLTTKQICLFVCPKTANNHSTIMTADTQILQIDNSNGNYSSSWQVARNAPIIQYAVVQWHWEDSDGDCSTVRGPVSCRDLAELFHDESDAHVSLQTRVYSQLTQSWKPIQDLPGLQVALDAFYVDSRQFGTMSDMSNEKEAKSQLEAFLSSTIGDDDHEEEDAASYQSDNGTRYIKDFRTGNWIHEALAPTSAKRTNTTEDEPSNNNKKKKQKKGKFAARNARCWVYVSGLPTDTTEEELDRTFAKAGLLDLDPETQLPKRKLYRYKDGPQKGQCKGDASLCYARSESVQLAITLLDDTDFRPGYTMKVEPAKFEQRGALDEKRKLVSNAQRKVARLATIQARDWDEGEFNGRLTGGRKGLRIIVMKHLFDPSFLKPQQEDSFFELLEKDLRTEMEKFGVVEKITVFSKHPDGVAIVKFTQPGDAGDAVKAWNGMQWKSTDRPVRTSFWDGDTDFTVRDELKETEETQMRLNEFGNWLENQELPEELRLQTE